MSVCLFKFLNIHISLTNHWRTSYIKILSVSGNRNVLYFLNWLYKDATIYLDRKYKKYLLLKDYMNKIANNPRQLNNKTSLYKGVHSILLKNGKKYEASIKFKNKIIHLGRFLNEKDAAIAYNNKAKELLGDKAVLNNIGS
jgi:hypothetical protein